MTWQPLSMDAALAALSGASAPQLAGPELRLNQSPSAVWKWDDSSPGGQRPWPLRAYVWPGDLHLPSLSFVTNHFVMPEADVLIVEGNLSLDEDLLVEQDDVGTPGYLRVNGHLSARHVVVAQQFELMVAGDLRAQGVVVGQEGSSGQISCLGALSGDVVMVEGFTLRCGELRSLLLCPDHGDRVTVTRVGDGGVRVGTTPDEDFGLLYLPLGIDAEAFETSDDARRYAVWRDEVIAAHFDRYVAGDLPSKPRLQDVLRQHGRAGLNESLWGGSMA